ncbi:hypothetical protein C0991_002821, partial [Blastosporella zonata]
PKYGTDYFVDAIPDFKLLPQSVLAIILFKAFSSLAIATPPVREISRKPRSDSLTSSGTPTLVDTDEDDAKSKSKPEAVRRSRAQGAKLILRRKNGLQDG